MKPFPIKRGESTAAACPSRWGQKGRGFLGLGRGLRQGRGLIFLSSANAAQRLQTDNVFSVRMREAEMSHSEERWRDTGNSVMGWTRLTCPWKIHVDPENMSFNISAESPTDVGSMTGTSTCVHFQL